MNLNDELSANDKIVDFKNIMKKQASATLIKLKKGGILKEHQSKTNALLILLSGKVLYKEAERTVSLAILHDFVRIPERLTHKVIAENESLLLLIQ